MTSLVTSYKTHAEAFQAAKIGNNTDVGKAFTAARGELKIFSQVAKDAKSFIVHCIKDPGAQEKALKKFEEWSRKAFQSGVRPDAGATYNPEKLISALKTFETAFVDSTKEETVLHARLM